MSTDVDADLLGRLERLQAENSTLRHRLAAQPPPGGGNRATRRRRGWGWTALAASLVILGCLSSPLAVVGGWSRSALTDTDAFVATFAPLADDPDVQRLVVDQTAAAVNESLDFDQFTAEVIDGIKALGTRPRASAALDALGASATQALQASVRDGIAGFVASDQFSASWESALRLSHTSLLATMNDDPRARIAAGTDGTIGVQIGPIVADVKDALEARGVSLASRIPAVDRTIPIATATQLPAIQTAYRTVVAVGGWLPWLSLLLLTGGVLVARRRSVALLWAAVGLGVSMALLLLALAVGRALLLTAVPAGSVPSSVTALLYGTATEAMRSTAVSTLVLAAAIALVGWLAGPFQAPRRLRRLSATVVDRARQNAEAQGVTTGRVGEWVYGQRRVLQVLIALAAAAAIVFIRPLSLADLGWTALLAVLALVVVSLVERPPSGVAPKSLVGEAGD